MSTIGRQVSRGVFWVSVSTLTAQGLSFITSLILMRLLPVSDFGLVALATLAINTLQLLREFGFSSALIYRKDNTREAANTMFVLLMVTSLVLYIIAYVGAPAIAHFFYPDDLRLALRVQLIEILRVLALVMVLGSVGQVPFTLLAKQMDFRKRLLPDIVPEIFGGVTTIGLALLGYGVWSLVYGQIVDILLTAVLAWVVSPLRPGLQFSPRVAREMFDYGKHIMGSQILIFFITNIDDAFVGKLRGQTDLGIYGQAYKLSNLPATHITRLVGQVMFPALARVRDNLAQLRHVFLRAVKYVSLISVPLGVGIFVFSPDFMDILYGAKWKEAIVPIQWLVVYGTIRSVAANMGDVFKARGKPQWLLGIAAWRLATMAVFLYPVTVYWGIVGVSALSALVAVVDFGISMTLCNRVAGTTYGDFAGILAPVGALSAVSALAGWVVFRLFYGLYPPLALVLGAATMVLGYAALVLRLDGEVRLRLWGMAARVPAAARVGQRLGWQMPATDTDEL